MRAIAKTAFFLCLSLAAAFSVYRSRETHKFGLEKVPYGEETGLVKGVKRVEISQVTAPYNASIVEDGEGYLLFFRYDVPIHAVRALKIKSKLKAYIGCVKLDAQFNQAAPFTPIDTRSDFSEDPRAVRVNEELLLSYNDVAPNPQVYSRTIRLAPLDRATLALKETIDLDLHISPIEKNWVPFEYQKALLFTYSINPHKILKVEGPEITHLPASNADALQKFSWEKKWGILRRGTPPKLIDGQYLSFFHSAIKRINGTACYVDGRLYLRGASSLSHYRYFSLSHFV